MARMFPIGEERKVILQWLAHMFQRPAERPSWHIMVTSDHGTGKGYLYKEILMPLIGSNQVSLCESTYSNFLDKNSIHLFNTQLCILDDCESTTSRNVYGRMKSKLSEEYASVEPKYENRTTVPVFTRIWLNSNKARPFPIESQDRRWFAPSYIELPEDQASTAEYLEGMDAYLADDGLTQIYSYLMTLSLDGFNPKATYQTDTLKSIISLSSSFEEEEVKEWCEENKVFKLESLQSRFSDKPDLAKTLALNYCQTKSIDIDGSGRSNWWIPKGWKPKQAKEYYAEQQPQRLL
ncbi:MAG: primase-helicase family protein [Vibrio casei]|uniref:primase-helicase family protein n=2 Tax=Vibrionaceae TaxID=641 RepID=UPI001866EED1|nr:primase-helicase family protein [Vibrio casei]